jgi:AcrR family transcriptional regulator
VSAHDICTSTLRGVSLHGEAGMSEDARMRSDVPEALIRSAERLFAEHGSDAVSLRDIIAASGATNASAVQYHFGDRRGLVRAILAKHGVAVERRRHEMLDAYEAGTGPDVHALAAALVRPLAAELNDEDGGLGYLQLVADLYNRPNPTFDPSALDDRTDSFQRWRALVMPILTPEAVRLHRRFDALRFTVSELARRGRTGRRDHRLFTSQLTDLVAALLLAPVSDETRRLFRT